MSNLNEMLSGSMAKLKEMVDVNTVVGTPINLTDGTILIPVSRVTFGFASGGTDGAQKSADSGVRFGGGSGAGASVTPVAFLVVKDGSVRMIYIEPPQQDALNRAIDLVPDVIDKIKDFTGKNGKSTTEEEY